jgi:hypothetical protein
MRSITVIFLFALVACSATVFAEEVAADLDEDVQDT